MSFEEVKFSEENPRFLCNKCNFKHWEYLPFIDHVITLHLTEKQLSKLIAWLIMNT